MAGLVEVDFDPARKAYLPGDDALVDQVHPVLDARKAVRDLCEVSATELFLLSETERTMVRRHDRQIICPQASPKCRLMLTGTKWWCADELRALEARACAMSCSDKNRYCGQVSAKVFWPRSRASITAARAGADERWTM